LAFTIIGVVVALAFTGSTAAAQSVSIERGKYLVNTVGACGNCHNARDAEGRYMEGKLLSGGARLRLPQSTVYGANITPDPETGIGSWSDEQVVRAIREGVRPDGSIVGPPMPVEMYRHMSDDDAKAIVAYLRTLPSVKNEVPRGKYEFPVPTSYGPPVSNPAPVGREDLVKYGEYLAGPVGHCMACHTGTEGEPTQEDLETRPGTGGRRFGPGGNAKAANLTPHETGLKDWTDTEIARAIRDGISRDGRTLKPPMAFSMYKNISDQDMQAIISYLRSLKPLPTGG
jgi:mono/diheme cytochrome c family protein